MSLTALDSWCQFLFCFQDILASAQHVEELANFLKVDNSTRTGDGLDSADGTATRSVPT